MVGILCWSSKHACCTSSHRERPFPQILVLSRWYYTNLFSRFHIQVRLMGNLCLNSGIPWLSNTEGSLCFICKESTETVNHHFIDCPAFKNNYSSLWSNLKTKIINCNQTDGIAMGNFVTNLDSHRKFHCCWEDSTFLLMMLR